MFKLNNFNRICQHFNACLWDEVNNLCFDWATKFPKKTFMSISYFPPYFQLILPSTI